MTKWATLKKCRRRRRRETRIVQGKRGGPLSHHPTTLSCYMKGPSVPPHPIFSFKYPAATPSPFLDDVGIVIFPTRDPFPSSIFRQAPPPS